MKYKLLALDIDGTLLDDNRQLSEENISAIKRAVDSGVHVTICTGRPIQGVKWLVDRLGITTPVITYNGAEIVDPATNEILFKNQLLPIDATKIATLGKELGVTLIIWSQGRLYGYPMNDRVEFYKQIALTEPKEVTDVNMLAEEGITKIIWFDEIERINQLKTQLNGTDFESVTYVTSNPRFLEFFNSAVSKRISMERLAEILGVSREETVAIGDGYNDVPMLEGVGLSIAMGNAPDDIKRICKAVTDDNNHDGVAKAIEQYILCE